MTLFEMYKLLEYITNKDYEGNVIPPDQFKALAVVADLELFKIKMGLPEDYKPGQPVPRQYPDATQLMTDDTKFLRAYNATQAVTAGVISFPANYFICDSIRYLYQRNVDAVSTVIPKKVEILTEDEISDRLGRWIKKPSTSNPVGVIRNNGIHVYPSTIAEVQFSYIRYPVPPVFAYTSQIGYIEEDAVNTTEFEWPKHLHMDLVRIMLAFIGVNIRDEQVIQYAEQKKAQGV